MGNCRAVWIAWMAVYAALCGVQAWCAAGAAGDAAEPTSDQRVHALIHQLGAEAYPLRQAAQEELARMGPTSFDALFSAQQHEDIEVAARAEYLVRLIRTDWLGSIEHKQVRQALAGYDSLDDASRLERLRLLLRLPGDIGLEALCRAIRFERSTLVSKQAALLLMEALKPGHSSWAQQTRTVQSSIEGSNRAAAQWLQTFVGQQQDPRGAAEAWAELVEAERQVQPASHVADQGRLVLLLMRRQVILLSELEERDRAIEVMREMIALETGDPNSLIDMLDWLVKQQAWPLVDEVAARFDPVIRTHSPLQYAVARARRLAGQEELAVELAEAAFRRSGGDASERWLVATQLYRQGLADWAEREFREVIRIGPRHSERAITSGLLLSEMLHDHARHADAARALQTVVDAMDSSPQAMQQVHRMNRDPEAVRSRLKYFYACAHDEQGEVASQRAALEQAIEFDATDADVLIALYRMPDQDARQRAQTLERIAKAADHFREQINDDPEDSTPYNQYAWLIGNTEGDFDEAIRFSHRSVELQPEAGGYFDTLAHCYAAKKDYARAVKYQSRAVELDPHSQQIRRAMQRFEEQLAASGQSGEGAEDRAAVPGS